MASRSKSTVTTDHDEIRQWAEERGARPACVRGTGRKGDVGMIRLDFPGYSGADSLEEISWDDWFQQFDENGLALLHQETTAGGDKSNFNKLIARETAAARARGDNRASRHAGRGKTRSASATRSSRSGSSRSTSSRGGRRRSAKSASRAKSSRTRSTGRRSTTANTSGTGRSRRKTATARGRSASRSTRGKTRSSSRTSVRRSNSRAGNGRTSRTSGTKSRGNRSRTGKPRRSGRVITMKRRSGRGGSRRAA